jgi:hypothetical protein
MALNFTGNTTRVTHAASATIDNLAALTLMYWCQLPTSPQGQYFAIKDPSAGTMEWYNSSGDVITFRRARATSALRLEAAVGNFSAYVAGAWIYVCVIMNSGGADGDQKLLMGSLTAPAAEPSSYSSRTVGSGALTSESGQVLDVGAAFNLELNGPGAIFHLVNRAMPVAEVQAQRLMPRPVDGSVIFCHYGYNGTGTQPDWSGKGNSGTVTAATVAAHVPLGPPFGFLGGWKSELAPPAPPAGWAHLLAGHRNNLVYAP